MLRKFSNDLTFNIRNINYKKYFKDTHELEALFGQELRSVDRNSNNHCLWFTI
jgi:hypothetical protein